MKAAMAIVAASLLSAVAARAAEPIRLDDVSGTAGQWQEGSTVVEAPIEEVRAWLLDFAGWTRRFPDVVSLRVLRHTSPNVWIVRFRSRIVGDVSMRVHASPNEVVYSGLGPDRAAACKIRLRAVDDQRTMVTMQTSSQPHGFVGLSATGKVKRRRAFQKLQNDLSALQTLAAERRSHL
jgi:hypothetical protein